MKGLYFCLVSIVCFAFSCQNSNEKVESKVDSLKQDIIDKPSVQTDTSSAENDEYQYANYEVIVIDTNISYATLNKKMDMLKNKLGMEVDLLGRVYNEKKDLIMLPENDKDEIYAGEYFPRRELSNTLSLEYMEQYQPSSKPKTIGLIAGIYANTAAADSALKVIKTAEPKAFKLNSRIYIGCMH